MVYLIFEYPLKWLREASQILKLHKSFGKLFIQLLDFSEHVSFLVPNSHLLRQLWDYQKGAPRSLLLRFDNVTENVVANVKHILATGSNQLGKHITVATRVDFVFSEWPRVATEFSGAGFNFDFLHACAFLEEQGFPCVNQNVIKVGSPVATWFFIIQ